MGSLDATMATVETTVDPSAPTGPPPDGAPDSAPDPAPEHAPQPGTGTPGLPTDPDNPATGEMPDPARRP